MADSKIAINPFGTHRLSNDSAKQSTKEDAPLLHQNGFEFNARESYGLLANSPPKNQKGRDRERLLSKSYDIAPLETSSSELPTLSSSGKIAEALDNYFQITQRGSTITTEIRGGTVGFLTLAYIVLLNPQVLAISGIPYKYAASSTCLASCIATLICGLWGNIPVGCGPGVGLSAYFSYGMIPNIPNDPYLSGLLMAFLSGLIVFVLTIPGLVTYIVNTLPHFIKVATIVGMGLFLAFVGMVDVGLVVAANGQGNAILELGDMTSWVIWLSLVNCLLIATLKYFKLNGSLLLCIVIISILYFAISGDWPTKFVEVPQFQDPLLVLNFEMMAHLPLQVAFESIISFVLILFLDVSGVTFAIAKLCGLSDCQETLTAFQKSAFIGTSIGSMIAAIFGCSPIIVCIETSSGAAAGARTGLSAVVIACYFLVAMFFGPVLGQVPPAATSPVLIFIGTLMMGQVGQIAWDNMRIAIPAFFCIVMMPFTYSISNGLFFGVFAFFLSWLSTGQFLSRWTLPGFELLHLDEIFEYTNVTEPQKQEMVMDYSPIAREFESPFTSHTRPRMPKLPKSFSCNDLRNRVQFSPSK